MKVPSPLIRTLTVFIGMVAWVSALITFPIAVVTFMVLGGDADLGKMFRSLSGFFRRLYSGHIPRRLRRYVLRSTVPTPNTKIR